MQRKQRFVAGSFLTIATAVLLAGCLKSNNDTPQVKQTFIYLMHMAPEAPGVDLFFNDTKVTQSSFGFGSASSSYGAYNPGAYSIKFKKSGGDSVVASYPATLFDSLKPYSVVLFSDEQGHGQAFKINDNFANVSTTKLNYRFWHLGYGTDPVDVYIDNQKVFAGRSLGDNASGNSYNEFSQFAAGFHGVKVTLAGRDSVIAQSSNDLNFTEGSVYTIYLKGKWGGTGTNALAVGVSRNYP